MTCADTSFSRCHHGAVNDDPHPTGWFQRVRWGSLQGVGSRSALVALAAQRAAPFASPPLAPGRGRPRPAAPQVSHWRHPHLRQRLRRHRRATPAARQMSKTSALLAPQQRGPRATPPPALALPSAPAEAAADRHQLRPAAATSAAGVPAAAARAVQAPAAAAVGGGSSVSAATWGVGPAVERQGTHEGGDGGGGTSGSSIQ